MEASKSQGNDGPDNNKQAFYYNQADQLHTYNTANMKPCESSSTKSLVETSSKSQSGATGINFE